MPTYTGTLNTTIVYTVFAPQCGPFSRHPAAHYFCLFYLPLMSSFAVIINSYVIYLLLLTTGNGGEQQLLQQSQHVYVLGSAVTNLLVAVVCNFMGWIANHVVPCLYLGTTACFVYNLVNYAGGYQMMFNVCLVCADRYRLVRMGAYYSHAREIQRAKKLLIATSIFSVLLFVVPEVLTSSTVGVDVPRDFVRCRAAQEQEIPALWNITLGNYMAWSMSVLPWVVIVVYVVLTVLGLRGVNIGGGAKVTPATGTATTNNSIGATGSLTSLNYVNNRKRLLRASLIMFGTVATLLITYGPMAVGLVLYEYELVGFVTIEVLVYIQFSHPAVDPFAYALTLPKLRARAAKHTVVGRMATRAWSSISKLRVSGNAATVVTVTSLLPPNCRPAAVPAINR